MARAKDIVRCGVRRGLSALFLIWLLGEALLASALSVGPVLAQTNTLNPGSPNPCGGCWSFGQWSLGHAPQTGEDVVLNTSSPMPNNYDLVGVTLHSLTINPSISVQSYAIGGNVIGLQSGGFITDSNNTTGPDAINTGVSLNGPATITLSAGATGLSFGVNPITGAGPLTIFNNSTDDALRLNVANSYTGATVINGTGRVFAAVNGAIPTGNALTVNGSVLFGESSTIGSLAGGGNVFMTGSNTLTVGGDNSSTTFSGVYQDSGGAAALTKTGAGTLILTGNNTYTGGTTITGGMLELGNGGASGSILGNVINNGIFAISRSDSFTFGGAISGTGAFQQNGPGTTILTAANTYSGPTAIGAGTLQAGAVNAFAPASAFTVASGATLNLAGFNQTIGSLAGAGNVMLGAATLTTGGDNTSTTYSGVISGTGGLVKTGAGTLTLSGPNSYSGGTTLAGGTLRLENNSALGTGALTTTGSVVDYASGATIGNPIVINSNTTQLQVTTGSATQAGAISELNGPRPLEKIGAGTLIFTAANTYSGPTTISAGTLQLGNGGTSGSILGNVVNNGIFAINRSDAFTFSNVISGTGAFQQNGTGATTLTATNTYTGPTAVNAGALIVNGSIANSAVTVNAGALLAGTGTVGATTINAGGMFLPGSGAPGSSMTVAGNLAFQSGALYLVQVNPSSASSANVIAGGSAALAGTVNAAFAAGSYVTRTYTILSAAGGLGGTTFNTLTTTNLPAGFTANLSYTASDVILNLTATLGQASGPSALGTGGLSGNQRNVANALNNFFNSGGALPPAFVSVFGLTGANLGNALSQLSGEAATGAQQVGFQMESQFLNLMLDPFVDGRSGIGGADHPALGFAPDRETLPDDVALAYSKVLKAPPKAVPVYEPRWTVWGGAYGGSNRTTGDLAVTGSHDLAARTVGFAGGFDYHLSRDSVVGLAFAGGGTNWDLAQGLGGGRSDAFQAGVYGATKSGPAYLAAAFAFANHWMSTDRFAFGDHLTADFNAQSYGGRLEGGYRFGTPYGGIAPYAAIQAQSFHTPGYAETGLIANGFALAFNGRDATDTRSELGARFDRVLALYPNAVLALRGRLAWAHDWVSDPTLAAVFQTLRGASFIVNGAIPAKDSALVSAGAEYRLASGVTLLAKFDGEFASRSSTYAGTGTVRYSW
jgi:autotransporter-associated beta strand protein